MLCEKWNGLRAEISFLLMSSLGLQMLPAQDWGRGGGGREGLKPRSSLGRRCFIARGVLPALGFCCDFSPSLRLSGMLALCRAGGLRGQGPDECHCRPPWCHSQDLQPEASQEKAEFIRVAQRRVFYMSGRWLQASDLSQWGRSWLGFLSAEPPSLGTPLRR